MAGELHNPIHILGILRNSYRPAGTTNAVYFLLLSPMGTRKNLFLKSNVLNILEPCNKSNWSLSKGSGYLSFTIFLFGYL